MLLRIRLGDILTVKQERRDTKSERLSVSRTLNLQDVYKFYHKVSLHNYPIRMIY